MILAGGEETPLLFQRQLNRVLGSFPIPSPGFWVSDRATGTTLSPAQQQGFKVRRRGGLTSLVSALVLAPHYPTMGRTQRAPTLSPRPQAPPEPCAFLQLGQRFEGRQRVKHGSKGEHWNVTVTIQVGGLCKDSSMALRQGSCHV